MPTALHWFRNDLRVHDNPALFKAISLASIPGDSLVCIYCHDPALNEILPWGARRQGKFRSQFLRETLDELHFSLKQRGSNLIEVFGPSAQTIAECALLFGAYAITYQQEVAPEELGFEIELRAECGKLGIKAVACGFSTLINFSKIAEESNLVSDVFTKFRTEIEAHLRIDLPLNCPDRMPMLPAETAKILEVLQSKFGVRLAKNSGSNPALASNFCGGESKGLARIDHYYWQTKGVSSYFDTRNGMLEMDCSTKFSPWLANGSLSARTCYFELKKYEQSEGTNKSTYWVFFELLWRDFFKAMALKYGSLLFKEGGIQKKIPTRQHSRINEELIFENWRHGKTGDILVDACMRELKATGFMSNRGRQIAASFLIHDLGVRWTLGAWHFESLLLDYDPASNWGNWAYLAGVGNDPRGVRVFNTKRQAEAYDPHGDFVKKWADRQEK